MLRGREFFVFTGLQTGFLDLPELERDEIQASCFLTVVHPRAIALLPQSPQRRPRCRDRFEERDEPSGFVNERKMRERIQKRLMFVLSVQLDQVVGQLTQAACGRQRPVDVGATAPLAA